VRAGGGGDAVDDTREVTGSGRVGDGAVVSSVTAFLEQRARTVQAWG